MTTPSRSRVRELDRTPELVLAFNLASESHLSARQADRFPYVSVESGQDGELLTPFGHSRSEMSRIHDLFIRVALRPEAYCTRISERISVGGWSVERKVSASFHLPLGHDLPPRIVLPLMQVERGRAFADFTCSDESGISLPVLSKAENKFFAATTLFHAVSAVAQDLLQQQYPLTEESEVLQTEIGRVAKAFAAIPLRPPGQAYELAAGLLEDEVSKLGDSEPTKQVLAIVRGSPELVQLIRTLTSYYFVSIVYYTNGTRDRPIIRLAYRKTYIERLAVGKGESRRRLLQSLFGTTQSTYAFPVDFALRTNSYHLRIKGPDGNFVREQSIRYQDTEVEEPREVVRPRFPSDIQGRPSLPHNFVHLYVGNRGNPGDHRRMFARVQFLETPPGSLAIAASLSVVTAVILAVTTQSLESLVRSSSVISGIPALILAIPGAASVWLFPSYSMAAGQSPLRSRMALATVAGSCLVAALSISILSARNFHMLSGITYSLWIALIFANVYWAWRCTIGGLWNRKEHRRAIAISRQREDNLTISDINLLEKLKA